MNRTRFLTVVVTTAAAVGLSLVIGSVAEAKRQHKPLTCTIAALNSATAQHTASFTDRGIEAEDHWEAVHALCNNENVTGNIVGKSKLTLRPSTQRSKAPGSSIGVIAGPVTLDYSFGASQGGWVMQSNARYTCAADNVCTFNGQLKSKGKAAGKLSGTFLLPTGAAAGSLILEFTDILVSS